MAFILQAQADKGDNAPPHRSILYRATKKGLCLTEHPPHTILVFRLVETIGVSGGVCAMSRSLSTLFPAEDDVFDSREGGSRADQQAHLRASRDRSSSLLLLLL